MSPQAVRILVVDDDEVDRMSVRRIAETLGWNVEEASNLAEMRARLDLAQSGSSIECILLDFSLRDGDGFSALAALQGTQPGVPVVMLTGVEDAEVAVRLLNAGASDYLSKRQLSSDRLGEVVRRVTQLRRAEEERQRMEDQLLGHQRLLSAVIEQLPSGLLISDGAGNVLLRNAKWIDLLGKELGQLGSLDAIVTRVESSPPEAHSGRADLVRALQTKEATTEDFRLSSGTKPDVLARLRRFAVLGEDGETIARLALLDDVTDLRAAEAYQQQVMAIASHDLRNPLSAISMNAAILSRTEAMTDDRRVKTANRISSSANRMNRMIEDLFDYTLATLGKGIPVRPTESDMTDISTEAVNEARAAYPNREVVLTQKGNLRGCWDADRMHQVLQNLMGNALKYGALGAPIIVVCTEVADAAAVEIRVENQGEPIPPDLLPHVFDAYRRGPGSARHSLGLGLYIVRRIVEAHRGTIAVTSSPSDGTSFMVRLPKQPPSGEEPETAGARKPAENPRGRPRKS